MPERVRITEVAPRDGLQNESGVIPTESKVRLIELCCRTGVDEVEITSFVSPKWVPQLGDAAEVARQLFPKLLDRWPEPWPMLSALVPNEHGWKALWATDKALRDELMATHPHFGEAAETRNLMSGGFFDKISVFTAASETFTKRNINATIAESIERFRPTIATWKMMRRPVRGYISCVIACPFEGAIDPRRVADVAQSLVAIGVDEIDLGDTIGAADPASTVHMLEVVRDRLGPDWFAAKNVTLHLHDTFGRAAECVRVALDLGVRSFDGSVAGLGGCPYASTPGKRAPGNIATETLVKTIHDAGFETGVDLSKMNEAADYARRIVAESRSRAS